MFAPRLFGFWKEIWNLAIYATELEKSPFYSLQHLDGETDSQLSRRL